MHKSLMRMFVAGAAGMLVWLVTAMPADARRGGASDHFNSPGYQRALAESRKAYRLQIERQRAYEQHRYERQRARKLRPRAVHR
ncbi:MAG: hypothetical protein ACOY4O_20115 [Pseudomonadota bacterium]